MGAFVVDAVDLKLAVAGWAWLGALATAGVGWLQYCTDAGGSDGVGVGEWDNCGYRDVVCDARGL